MARAACPSMCDYQTMANICTQLKEQHGGMYGTAGIPDIIACINRRFVAFEVKTPTSHMTKLQEITIQKIKDAPMNSPNMATQARSYLSRTQRVDRRIEAKRAQVAVLRDLSTSGTAQLSDMPRSDSPSLRRMETLVCKIALKMRSGRTSWKPCG